MKSFVLYISRVLRNISNHNLTKDSKHLLNCIVTETLLIILAHTESIFNREKIWSPAHFEKIIDILFHGSLKLNMIEEGYRGISSKQSIFSHSTFNWYMKQKKTNDIRIDINSSYFLARAIEYFCFEILDLSIAHAFIRNKIRIIPADIYNAICTDNDLNCFFKKCNIKLYSIQPLTFSTCNFQHVMKSICFNIHNTDIKFSKKSVLVLQEYIERFVIDTVEKAQQLSSYRNKHKIKKHDIEMTHHIFDF